MELNNEYIKDKLSHVYWLNGGPCSGKTTMTNKLVEEYDFINIRDDIMKYRKFTDENKHPNLQYPNSNINWDLWFNRPTDTYVDWLHGLGKEFLGFFIVDLLTDKSSKKIVVDLGILAEEIIDIIPKERIICLYTTEKEINRQYFFRHDHKMILDRINLDTKNPRKTIENANKSMVKLSNDIVNSCERYVIKTIKRTPDLSVEEQFSLVKKYFEL